MKPPGGESHDIFGADFSGTPSHHRVLKPPGGGTSDIFNGTGGQAVVGGQQDGGPRRVRNMQPTSQLFGEDQVDTTPRKENGVHNNHQNHQQGNADSHWRLFGPPPARPAPNIKSPNKRLFGASNEGNPVTGEGYENDKNGTVSSSSSEAGSVASLGGSSNGGNHMMENGNRSSGGSSTPSKPRARVPPGGYSSGFW